MEEKNYLTEAFQALADLELNEDVFTITDAGIEEANDFIKETEVDDFEDIIDPLAQTEEELEDSYLGKAILDCEVCHSKLYKDPEEVVIDEEAQLANIDEACPYCQSNEGFKIIGQVAEYCPHCEDEDEEHTDTETEEETEIEENNKIEESNQLNETGEWEDDDEGIAWKEGLAKLVREYTSGIKEFEFDDSDIEGFDKYQGPYIDTEIGTIWSDGERDDSFIVDCGNAYYRISSREDAEDLVNGRLKPTYIEESCNTKKSKKSLKEMDNVYDVRTKQGHKFLVKAKDEDSAKDSVIKNYRKTVIGDFDADKVTKTNKTNISESDKPAAVSIEDAQKWVDYDMKKYGRISGRTNRLVKKAGFQIIKDDHGDYEVAAGKFESVNEEVEKVDIETESDRVTMEQDENGKVVVTTEPKETVDTEETAEVIAPVDPETEEKFEVEGGDDFEDVDFDEFEETDFDTLGEKYLKRVYENVKSFKTTKGSLKGNKLQLEGLITFKSGKEAKTNFIFEAHTISKTGKLKFLGENKQFAKGKKSFTLTGHKQGNKLMMESLTYNYQGRDSITNKTQKVYGRVSR